MRTSEEIYHRVRWDIRFDPARFVVEVSRRGAPPKRIPLPAFVPGGEIPWHRVLRIEADGEVVWDRATRLDRIDTCAVGRAHDPRRLRPPFFTAREPHTYDPARAAWRPAPPPGAGVTVGNIRVLTWNTLWDRYDGERIDTARRRPLLLAALAAADADVIALQEVESDLVALLAAEPWVRAAYTMDTDPAGHDIADSGLLLLSRLPVREAARHALGPYKALAAITVTTGAEPLVLAVTHLTSDHAADGPGRRRVELAALADGLAGVPGDLVVVGDFNDGTNGPSGPAAALGLADAWTHIHGAADETPTFDPTVNPLAAIGSRTGRAARLDRILLRTGAWRSNTATLYGDTPTPDGLYISDHFGVQTDLVPSTDPAPDTVLDVAPTARTALAWLPPKRLWPALQALRHAHDPQVDRWPPHVNILFGFVPEADFDRAAPLLAAAATRATAFTARLDGVHTFGHREDATVWLDPAAADHNAWARLHQTFADHFPNCARPDGYTPHLTLGRSSNPQHTAGDCAAHLTPMSARVSELTLLSRRADEPMRPRATIDLTTGTIHWLRDPSTHLADSACAAGTSPDRAARADTEPAADAIGRTSARSELGPSRGEIGAAGLVPAAEEEVLARRIARRIAGALGDGVVSVVGSRRMGCALAGADLDLVAALPGTIDLADVAARVGAALPEAVGLRPVLGARVPGLRLAVGELGVDLVLVGTGRIAPADAMARRTESTEPAAIALSAVTDADTIRAAVGAEHERFATLARQVKAWARARGLDSAPFGQLPGVAWSILAARSTIAATEPTDADLLRDFFATWAAWDWRKPVTLDPHGGRPIATTGTPVSILTPTTPMRLCTEQVGPGSRDLLTEELYRAWEILTVAEEAGTDPWPDLVAPPPLHRRHAAWAVLTVLPAPAQEFEATIGRLRGRIRALLTLLHEAGIPDAHAWPRPFESGSHARYAIGLGQTPPSADTLESLTTRWTKSLPGTTLTRTEGGAVPTLR
ncbi:poly(A) polymerase [Embleya sp. AB8]|uniref:poly(A) polymerase n=1 Tax=Embleya sp. AB8 TaxID=3156304 RepID=UPI003C75BB4C